MGTERVGQADPIEQLTWLPLGMVPAEQLGILKTQLAIQITETQKALVASVRVAFEGKETALERVWSLAGSPKLLIAHCEQVLGILRRVDEQVGAEFAGEGGRRALAGFRKLAYGISQEASLMHWPEQVRARLLRVLEVDPASSNHLFSSAAAGETFAYTSLTPLLGIVERRITSWCGSRANLIGSSLLSVQMGSIFADRVSDLVCRHFKV